jgi:hypothetical protein
MTTLNTFFDVASPTTLASLIADVRSYDTTDPDQIYLAAQAETALRANVGPDEARQMVDAAGGGA